MREIVEEALSWYWLVFALPLIFGVVLFIGTSLGGTGDSDLDGDAQTGPEPAAGGDTGHGAIHDAVVDHAPHLGARLWAILGVGKVPLMFVLATMSLLFGAFGLALQKILGPGWFLLNLGVASAAMLLVTPMVVRMAARWMPQTETYVDSVLGQQGNSGVLVVNTSTTFGLVQVTDGQGNSYRCKCSTYEGTLPKGTEVLLVELDADNVYKVEEMRQ